MSVNVDSDSSDSNKLAGLFNFATGILSARSKTRLRVDKEKLGCFREQELLGVPGLSISSPDGNLADDIWLQLQRLKPGSPPLPENNQTLLQWLDPLTLKSPERTPELFPLRVIETTLADARDRLAAGVLKADALEIIDTNLEGEPVGESEELEESSNAHEDENNNVVQDAWNQADLPGDTQVKITLNINDHPAVQTDYNNWLQSSWQPWAKVETPVRHSISLYKKFFRLHTQLHSGDSSANELVWGVGMAEHGKAGSSKRLDIPLVEFLLDIDLQDNGTITLTPRDVPAYLNLRPLMEAGLDGAEHAQSNLQERFMALKSSDDFELTPFYEEPLDEYFNIVAGQISSDAEYIDRASVNNLFQQSGLPEREPSRLRINASWVIYGRPRSSNFRVDDLNSLRESIVQQGEAELPEALGGFVLPLPDSLDDDSNPESTTDFPSDWGEYVEQTHAANSYRYYFPLASNEDQNQIVKELEKHPVVTVTGPPGTGKTHSIANIVAHYMATGRRVLVTARTAEAIAAVQSKLPPKLSSLIIASVASDREGTRQLESAIKRLSDEVLELNDRQLEADISAATRAIENAEAEILDCERSLARISQRNLTPIAWQGKETTVMELSETLDEMEPACNWFLDRPEGPVTETVTAAVHRMLDLMASHPNQVGYVNQALPTAEELPTTQTLLDYHQRQQEIQNLPKEDYSNEPPMALDTPQSHQQAQELEEFFTQAASSFAQLEPWHHQLCSEMMHELVSGHAGRTEKVIDQLFNLTQGRTPPEVRIDYRQVERDELLETLNDRKSGRGGSFFGGLFNRALNEVVDSATVSGNAPGNEADWQHIIDWIAIDRNSSELKSLWQPQANTGQLPAMPAQTHELASQIATIKTLADKAKERLPRIAKRKQVFDQLFPHGINSDEHFARLEFDRLGRALRANLNLKPESHPLQVQLGTLANSGPQPFFQHCKVLNDSLHAPDSDARMLVEQRNTLSHELQRLREAEPVLSRLNQDLQLLKEAGVPEFSALIQAECVTLTSGQPTAVDLELDSNADTGNQKENWQANWPTAWEWAAARKQLDAVLTLGNGDSLRARKQQAIRERESRFLQLIESKTRAGLKQRITPQIRAEFLRFTQAIGKLGAGTGKSAYRHRKTIKDAARKSSSAVPVWVMPENKVCEQLPASLGMFDLVILDEASQSDITSLGVLSRGKKLLIVGDEQQVSPSAVGVTIERVDQLRAEFLQQLPNRDSYDEKTSIFDMAMLRYPQSHLMLREHFRCVHPIIEFSTRFYNGRLIPLRVPKASERFDPPLVDVHIKGATRNGKVNEAEADYIVEEIATLTANPEHKERDIAVISFIGGEQAEHIERLLIDDPRIGPEVINRHQIICGDSRTLQGQERSIVFLSMVADPGNARTQRSREDRQRFNVAMSRARDREYIIRSVSGADLNTDDLKNEVIQHFKDPLPGGRAIVGTDILHKCESGFERDVCKRLLDAGYRVRSQVAAGYYRIDLVVEGENDSRLAIELDGDHWHGPEKWEDDMARQSALERAGWRFWRVFGSQWYSNKEYHWESLLSALQNEGIDAIGGEAVDELFTDHRLIDISELSNLGAVASMDGAEPPAQATLVTAKSAPAASTDASDTPPETKEPTDNQIEPIRFYDDDYQPVLTQLAIEIIDSSGPLNFDDLVVRIARKHDFARTGRKIHAAVRQSITGKREITQYPDTTEVLWPADQTPTDVVAFRGLTIADSERDWDLIPWPEKIGLAQLALERNPQNPVDAIMENLDITRAGKNTRDEFELALKEVGELTAFSKIN